MSKRYRILLTKSQGSQRIFAGLSYRCRTRTDPLELKFSAVKLHGGLVIDCACSLDAAMEYPY